jgi:hypothetical protein
METPRSPAPDQPSRHAAGASKESIMSTMTGNRTHDAFEPTDAERRTFSIVVLAGTIALAGAGMALAILLGAHAVRIESLAAIPFGW